MLSIHEPDQPALEAKQILTIDTLSSRRLL